MAGFIVMPILLTNRNFEESWTRDFVALEILAAVAALIAARATSPRPGREGDGADGMGDGRCSRD